MAQNPNCQNPKLSSRPCAPASLSEKNNAPRVGIGTAPGEMAEKKMAGESTIFTRQPPAGFDPEKPYADGLALWKQKEYVARETFVGIETSKVTVPFANFFPER